MVQEQISSIEDVAYMASRLREVDIQEIKASSGRKPHESLMNGFSLSRPHCFTLKMFEGGYPASSIPEDVRAVGNNLRQADLDEIKARGVPDPIEALQVSYEASKPEGYTAMSGGIPIAMMGVVPYEDNPRFGSIWLLGTDAIADLVPMTFLKWSRRFLPVMMEPYDMVSNIIDKRNTVHLKWLRWLGFSFIREVIHGPENRSFYEFAKVNKNV